MRVPLAVFLLIAGMGSAVADSADVDRSVARVYFTAAQDAHAEQLCEQARGFLEASLDHWPTYGDAQFELAKLLSTDRAQTRRSLALLEDAVDDGVFERRRPAEAAALLAGILERIGEYERALVVAQGADGSDPLLTDMVRADLLVRRARSHAALGQAEQALRLAQEGIRRFPWDPRFLSVRLAFDQPPDLSYRRALERFDPEQHRVWYLRLLLEYGLLAPTATERRWAAARYIDLGGTDPRVAEVLARAGEDTEAVLAAWDEVTRGGRAGDNPLDLAAFRDLAAYLLDHENTSVRDAVLAGLSARTSSYSGIAVVDGDRDGFWEERFAVSDGAVTRWWVDPDQDGLVDYEIGIADRVPVNAALGDEAFHTIVTYERYPFVALAELHYDHGTERVYVVPGRLRFEVMEQLVDPSSELPELLRAWELPRARPFLLDAQLREIAYRSEATGPGGAVIDSYLLDGEIVRERLDRDGDGYFEEYVVYRDGAVFADVLDPDADGYFEVARQYSRGGVVFTGVDDDDDGVPELRTWGAGPVLLEWDTNQDGRVDIREFRLWKDRVIRDFPGAERRPE